MFIRLSYENSKSVHWELYEHCWVMVNSRKILFNWDCYLRRCQHVCKSLDCLSSKLFEKGIYFHVLVFPKQRPFTRAHTCFGFVYPLSWRGHRFYLMANWLAIYAKRRKKLQRCWWHFKASAIHIPFEGRTPIRSTKLSNSPQWPNSNINSVLLPGKRRSHWL